MLSLIISDNILVICKGGRRRERRSAALEYFIIFFFTASLKQPSKLINQFLMYARSQDVLAVWQEEPDMRTCAAKCHGQVPEAWGQHQLGGGDWESCGDGNRCRSWAQCKWCHQAALFLSLLPSAWRFCTILILVGIFFFSLFIPGHPLPKASGCFNKV